MSTKTKQYSVPVGVDIDDIDPELRPASQMRVHLDREAVQFYAKEFADLPPVTLIYDPTASTHWLVDGCHTINAAKIKGLRQVRARIREGTRLDAFREAAYANQTHGVRITNADKRHRVLEALHDPEIGKFSQRMISDYCNVTSTFVSNIDDRKEDVQGSTANGLQLDGPVNFSVGKDGKTRRRPKRKKKQNQRPDPLPPESGSPPASASDDQPKPPPADVDPAESPAEIATGTPEQDPPEPQPPGPPESPSTNGTAATPFNWLERWEAYQQTIEEVYISWPEDKRRLFCFKLLHYANCLRATKHPEITVLTHEPHV